MDDDHIAEIQYAPTDLASGENATASFNVTGKFLGYATVCPQITYYSELDGPSTQNYTITEDLPCLKLTVIRESRAIDKAFTFSVVGLVCLMYVNMGAALDLTIVKENIRRPIGPVIGFMSQFVIMPLVSFSCAKAQAICFIHVLI